MMILAGDLMGWVAHGCGVDGPARLIGLLPRFMVTTHLHAHGTCVEIEDDQGQVLAHRYCRTFGEARREGVILVRKLGAVLS